MDNRGYQGEQFTPESVDEQLDQLSQASIQADESTTLNARLVHDLHSISHEYASTRDRVWDRMVAHADAGTQNVQFTKTNKIQEIPPERVHTMKQEVLYPRRAGAQRIALVAAALVAALLVASMALVFSLAHHQNNGIATGVTAAPTSSYRPYCGEQNAAWDAGWYTICSAHQEKILDIVKTLNGNRITVAATYADINRVMVAYEVKYVVLPSFPDIQLVLSTAEGVGLNGLGGSGGEINASTKTEFVVASFDTAAIIAATHGLNLHLRISAITADGKKEAGAFSIDFSLPVHAGRVANLQQVVTVDGIPITLDRVVVSPSQTRLYVLSPQLHLSDAIPSPYTLAVNGWHTSQYGFDAESLMGPTTVSVDNTGVELIENRSLFNQQGQWTFKIASAAVSGGKGTWTFHFTVPAA